MPSEAIKPVALADLTAGGSAGVVSVNSVEYVTTMLANLEAGILSVPLRNRDDQERLQIADTSRVIEPSEGTGWIDAAFTSPDGDIPAHLSFTSGTEGAPKAVLLSQRNLNDVVQRLTDAMEIDGRIREYVGVPVFHSFGYARCRVVLNAGGQCFLPGGGFNLTEIRTMLRAGEINAISAVPSLWRIFLDNLDMFGPELEQVEWVEIGSQYMSGPEKQTLRERLPNARIVQHYGLTEASRSTLLRIHSEPEDKLESVGKAEGDVEIRIGGEGRIEIKGPHVAMGILEDGVLRPLGRNAWLTTSDSGHMDGPLLYYEGRADDILNCGGIKLSPDLIENHVRKTLPGVGEFGVMRRPDKVRGDGVQLVLTSASADRRENIIDAICDYASESGLSIRTAIQVTQAEDLPRTATGKLQRKKLAAQLADATPAEPEAPPSAATHAAGALTGAAALFAELLGDGAFDRDATFLDLGGDSLLHMRLTLTLEQSLGSVPDDWESIPLGALIDRIDQADGPIALSPEDLIGAGPRAPQLPRGDKNMNPADIGFFALIAEDYRTNDASVFHQGFLMLLVHRFGNWRMGIKWKLLRIPCTILYRFFNKLTQLFFGMKLDYTVKVGRRVKLEHFGGMILGAREIGDDVILRQNTTFGIRSVDDVNAKPTIGNSVDIGAGAVVAGNIKVGENSIIGANSVVFTNIPPNSVAMGVPAKIIGKNPRQNPSPLGKATK